MTWEVLLPAAVSITVAILSPIVAIRLNKRSSDASVYDDQSAAMSRYWGRIAQLESENESLRGKIQALEKKNREFAAEIGNLYIELERLSRKTTE